ncbi:OmpP1/FadL family transporter [Thaumasiovibrio subtropicus]|uniref:OmpP1/FadL family transporter n=1 Tax=Thaumasiovibrio subtropicus TaxID=1891207 RepID=UPI000B35AC84|nr:outer membrane protein transport protein [Thaumasiovibrio subtropicus]
MKKTLISLALLSAFSSVATAGSIALHEVATFDSVASAGAANATNRKDASAAITSPAGLAAIEDRSWSIGLQYIDAANEQAGTLMSKNQPSFALVGKGENQALAPSLAYAQRINDEWVVGASLHADGGLGMDYDGGLIGAGLVDAMALEVANLNVSAAYQATPELSLGGAIVAQHLMVSAEAFRAVSGDTVEVAGDTTSTKLSFILSGMYDLSERTYLAANYHHKIDHSGKSMGLDINGQHVADMAINTVWPSRLSFGLHHAVTDAVNLKLATGIEFWSQYDKTSHPNAKDVYHFAAAFDYSHNSWTYQAGARLDSKVLNKEDFTPDFAVGRQWALGLGAEKTLTNGHRVALAYEFRDFGTPDVHYHYDLSALDAGKWDYVGQFNKNRLHILSLTYAY